VVNTAFTGFIVPAGTSSVRVSYVPMTFWIPEVASLITTVLLIAATIRDMRRGELISP
jgi:hypothetical protein